MAKTPKIQPVTTADELKERIQHRMLSLETNDFWRDTNKVYTVKGITKGGATIDVEADSWEAAYAKLPDWLHPE